MRVSLRSLLMAIFALGAMLAINLYYFERVHDAGSVEAGVIVTTLIAVDICVPLYLVFETLVDLT